MPVTPSHVVAVLPLLGRSGRVPAAALVVGSMIPDFPWFLTGGRWASLSHSLVGVVTVDLLAGLAAFVVWRTWAHEPVRSLLPPRLGDRLPRPAGVVARDLPWAALGVVIGALTHVGWDQFTHAGRAGVEAVPWLGADHAGLPGYKWAQYLSGVVGGVVLLVWCARRVARATPQSSPSTTSATDRARAWALLTVAALAGVALGLVTGGTRLETLLFGAVTRGGLAAAIGVAVVCVIWQVRRSSRRRARASAR